MTPHFCIITCAKSLTFCFVDLPYGNLLILKDQMDEIFLILLSFLCLFLTSLFLSSFQWLLALCAYISFIMAIMKSSLSGCNNISLKVQDSFCSWFDANTMGPKLFIVTSKCPFIYLMCWFALVGNMWGFFSTLHDLISAFNHLENIQ